MGKYGEQTKNGRVRTFGRNLHLGRVRVSKIVSEITGKPCGEQREHGDGRVDAVIKVDPVVIGMDEVDRFMPLNDFRRRLYELHRQMGLSHDEARYRLFPNGRILA